MALTGQRLTSIGPRAALMIVLLGVPLGFLIYKIIEGGLSILLPMLVSGILIGGIYALVGIGMTLIMGVMGIINLAHGQLMMVAMYITFVMFSFFDLDPFLSLIVTMPALFLLGALIQKFLLNPLLKVDSILPENQVLMTVGIGMVLAETARFIFTSDFRAASTTLSQESFNFELGSVYMFVNKHELAALAFAVALTVALFLFLLKTDTGKSVRATAQNKYAAKLMGVNTERITILTFGLGAAMVAAAGTLLLPIYYLNPDTGGLFTLRAFVITIMGGLGSTVGAIFGGLVLGVAETLGGVYLANELKEAVGMYIFLLVLIFLPGGLKKLTKI